MPLYASVILPLPLAGLFTYTIPDALENDVLPGRRVIVPFGSRKFYTGIVSVVSPVASVAPGVELKEIMTVLDSEPIVRHPQTKLWEWLADYYLCTVGDVYKAALPAGLKVESETMVEANTDADAEVLGQLTERESEVMRAIGDRRMSVKDVAKATGLSHVEPVIGAMLDKGAVIIGEKLVERYRARHERMVRLAGEGNEFRQNCFALVKGARKQEIMLMALLTLLNGSGRAEVTRASLLERSGATGAILKALEDKGVVEQFTREVSRFSYDGGALGESALPVLSEAQRKAMSEIDASFSDHAVTLLHGVTSSGKTELYIHLIDNVLRQGEQALMLVPEISLTTQLTRRLQKAFGKRVVIYHSKFSDNERVDIWRRMLSHPDPIVVIGTRSAVFLPFASLRLVIVDEEHDPSYKQQDPAPRYNGRDAAIVLASMHGAKTLLGSATPAIDTYYKATTGRFGLVTLSERYSGATLPEVVTVDMKRAAAAKAIAGPLAEETVKSVREAVDEGNQAIVFLNRRGYSPMARCKMCAYVPRCSNCDVALTYHRYNDSLHCHYCGATYPVPRVCPSCGEPTVEIVGFGTERVEETVQELFPDVPSLRMDLDTTRAKDRYADIIDSFSRGDARLLIGTQMVTKGLDFDKVSVVAVVNADSVTNFPDFRASERAFCMLAQVAGRAGRRQGQKARVMLQTRQPDSLLLHDVATHNYNDFYTRELDERRRYFYPPFTRIIYVYIKHRDQARADEVANVYAERLRRLFGTRVFGPDRPMVARVQQLYIRRVMLKVEVEASMRKVKDLMRELYVDLSASRALTGAVIYYDVDPY